MKTRQWIEMGVALTFLALTAGETLAEQAAVGQAARELGGGLYTIGAGWKEPTETEQRDPFSGTLFEPVENTARGVYEVNEGLLGTGNALFPTWEEIKEEGSLKKTFHF
jgi:hypothetical protein